MKLNTEGIVIRENETGENDRVVTLLTKDAGVIRAFVRGAKTVRNRNMSGTQLFGYSRLSVYRGRDAYTVDDAQPIEVFFKLRENIEYLSLAQYFCELFAFFAPTEESADDYLSLLLNALYLLSNGKRPQPLIKAVTELRVLCLSGYMPDIVACGECGKFSDETMYFDCENGKLFCSECKGSGRAINMGVVTALRYICYSEPKKIFNFTLSDEGLKKLSELTETYMKVHAQRGFKTLDFYKSLLP
ncbi:MAG: DNA repair protein RecO [Clostridiales bacterium]|nr:DNA repair protein RecO [Clostridiales bacterium]